MNKDNVLLFGGTFDPIHHGHLIVARSVAEQLDVEKTILIPSANPPHKSNLKLTDPKHRLAMTRLAVDGDNRFEVSDCELHRDAPSYTIDTVKHFRKSSGPSGACLSFKPRSAPSKCPRTTRGFRPPPGA